MSQQAILDALMPTLDEDHAIAVVEHRKAKRAPLTKHAAKLLAKQFARCADPNEAADEMMLRGWQGFKAEWVKDRDLTRRAGTGHGMIDALLARPHH